MSLKWLFGLFAALSVGPLLASDEVPEDRRLKIDMPPAAQIALRQEMLDKLQAVQQIFSALADAQPAAAADAAERQLGLSAMGKHRQLPPAARPGQYLPEAMHALGRQSHKNGSDLAEALKRGDRAEIDGRLRDTLGTCVACHTTYRVD